MFVFSFLFIHIYGQTVRKVDCVLTTLNDKEIHKWLDSLIKLDTAKIVFAINNKSYLYQNNNVIEVNPDTYPTTLKIQRIKPINSSHIRAKFIFYNKVKVTADIFCSCNANMVVRYYLRQKYWVFRKGLAIINWDFA